jgi:hypothetical protein
VVRSERVHCRPVPVRWARRAASTVLDGDLAVEVHLHQVPASDRASVVLTVHRSDVEDAGMTLSLAGSRKLSFVLRGAARVGREADR